MFTCKHPTKTQDQRQTLQLLTETPRDVVQVDEQWRLNRNRNKFFISPRSIILEIQIPNSPEVNTKKPVTPSDAAINMNAASLQHCCLAPLPLFPLCGWVCCIIQRERWTKLSKTSQRMALKVKFIWVNCTNALLPLTVRPLNELW